MNGGWGKSFLARCADQIMKCIACIYFLVMRTKFWGTAFFSSFEDSDHCTSILKEVDMGRRLIFLEPSLCARHF